MKESFSVCTEASGVNKISLRSKPIENQTVGERFTVLFC